MTENDLIWWSLVDLIAAVDTAYDEAFWNLWESPHTQEDIDTFYATAEAHRAELEDERDKYAPATEYRW